MINRTQVRSSNQWTDGPDDCAPLLQMPGFQTWKCFDSLVCVWRRQSRDAGRAGCLLSLTKSPAVHVVRTVFRCVMVGAAMLPRLLKNGSIRRERVIGDAGKVRESLLLSRERGRKPMAQTEIAGGTKDRPSPHKSACRAGMLQRRALAGGGGLLQGHCVA